MPVGGFRFILGVALLLLTLLNELTVADHFADDLLGLRLCFLAELGHGGLLSRENQPPNRMFPFSTMTIGTN